MTYATKTYEKIGFERHQMHFFPSQLEAFRAAVLTLLEEAAPLKKTAYGLLAEACLLTIDRRLASKLARIAMKQRTGPPRETTITFSTAELALLHDVLCNNYGSFTVQSVIDKIDALVRQQEGKIKLTR